MQVRKYSGAIFEKQLLCQCIALGHNSAAFNLRVKQGWINDRSSIVTTYCSFDCHLPSLGIHNCLRGLHTKGVRRVRRSLALQNLT